MIERFIENPNLPQDNVKVVISSLSDNSLVNALNEKSIKVLPIKSKSLLDAPVSSHADILIHHLGGKDFIADSGQTKIIDFLGRNGGNVITTNKIKSPYPFDCVLNCVDIGDYLICRKAVTNEKILNYANSHKKTVIDVKQGYSKCSVCVAARNTLITDDVSIFQSANKYADIKALLVEKGSVAIKKYDYGFIGGCSGLIGKNHLFFNGDLSSHKNFFEILKFLEENNIIYSDIKNKPLTDVGSILPIIESDGE